MKNRPYNVIAVIGSLEVGGTERQLSLIYPRLQAMGLNCAIVVLRDGGGFTATCLKGGVDVISVERKGLRKGLRMLAYVRDLYRLLRGNRQAVVHFHLPGAYILGGIAGVLARHPRMMMARRSQNLYQRGHPIAAFIERRLHNRMQLITTNTEMARRELVGEGVWKRIAVIPNGVDRAWLLAAAAPKGHFSSPLVITCVANLLKYKGHADLIEALGLIADKLPVGWRLMCAGQTCDPTGYHKNYADFAALQQRADELGIGGNIRWGLWPDTGRLWRGTDIGVLASHEEGMPNALLEGMTLGVPFVATKVGGIPEVTQRNNLRGAILVPSYVPELLAMEILRLAQDPDLRWAIGENARDLAVAYDLERCVRSYHQLYQSLLA